MEQIWPVTLAVLAASLAGGAALLASRRGREALLRRDVGGGPFAAAVALITIGAGLLAAALPVRRDLDGGAIERLYRADAFTVWEHLVRPGDYHHPGLWFALVRVPFVHTGHALWVPAALDRACAVAAIPLAALLVRSLAGGLAGLLAALNVALLPFLQEQSHEITDITLFVALALLAILAQLRGWRWTLALALGLALNASYGAVVLLPVLVADAVLTGRWRRLRWPLAGGVALGAPRILHLVSLVPLELAVRRQTAQLPWQHWSNVPFPAFLQRAMEVYLTPACWLLLPLMGAVFAVARAQWRRPALLGVGIAACAAVLLLHPIFRVRDYYAMLLPILLLLLVAAFAGPRGPGEAARRALFRRAAALVVSLTCAGAFAWETQFQWDGWVQREGQASRAQPIIDAAVADGAQQLAFDNDWQDTTWGFLADRYGTMGRCFRGEARCDLGYADAGSGRRVVSLGDDPAGKVSALERAGPVHVFIDRTLPDPLFVAFVAAHCRMLAAADEFEAWRCPG